MVLLNPRFTKISEVPLNLNWQKVCRSLFGSDNTVPAAQTDV